MCASSRSALPQKKRKSSICGESWEEILKIVHVIMNWWIGATETLNLRTILYSLTHRPIARRPFHSKKKCTKRLWLQSSRAIVGIISLNQRFICLWWDVGPGGAIGWVVGGISYESNEKEREWMHCGFQGKDYFVWHLDLDLKSWMRFISLDLDRRAQASSFFLHLFVIREGSLEEWHSDDVFVFFLVFWVLQFRR